MNTKSINRIVKEFDELKSRSCYGESRAEDEFKHFHIYSSSLDIKNYLENGQPLSIIMDSTKKYCCYNKCDLLPINIHDHVKEIFVLHYFIIEASVSSITPISLDEVDVCHYGLFLPLLTENKAASKRTVHNTYTPITSTWKQISSTGDISCLDFL